MHLVIMRKPSASNSLKFSSTEEALDTILLLLYLGDDFKNPQGERNIDLNNLGYYGVVDFKVYDSADEPKRYLMTIQDFTDQVIANKLDMDMSYLTRYLEILKEDGYAHSSHITLIHIKPKGIEFIRSGGYRAQKAKQLERERKEEERIEKQLSAALESAEASKQQVIAAADQVKAAHDQADSAKDSALFAKLLFGATLINILIVGFQAWDGYRKEDKPPAIIVSDEVKQLLEQNRDQMQQLQDQVNQLQSRISTSAADTVKN